MTNEPMQPQPFKVNRFQNETHDTFTLELEPPKGNGSFSFMPGQFNMLYAFGVGEVPISISGDPAQPGRLIHTTRNVGTVTSALNKIKKGGVVGVRGPFGTHWPVEQAEGKDVVIVTGGIGLAPLRPAIYHLLANRKKYNNIYLFYGARTPEDILYPKELAKWAKKKEMQVAITVDRAGKEWKGNVGVVTTLLQKAAFDAQNALAFVCGPEIMMHFTIKELFKNGMNPPHVYVSMERNMKCAIGFCGHCQFGPEFICKDGPVFPFERIWDWFRKAEI